MPDFRTTSVPSWRMSRRDLLIRGAVGVCATGLGVSGCQVQTTSDGPGPAASSDGLVLPDPAGRLPEGDVSIQWLSGGPSAKSAVFERLFPAYAEKHPNLTVQYDELPNGQITEALPLQVRNGDLPDVFQRLGIPLGQLVSGNHVAAFDDIIPDFAAWKAAMPFGVIVPGINEFDGKTYSLAPDSNRRCNMLLYNTEILERADVDPAASPMDLDEFRRVAKKITEQGQGEYYGVMVGGKVGAFGTPVMSMTMLYGGPPTLDPATGRYAYHDDTMVDVIEMLKAILDDGSFFPGWASLGDQEGRAQMPLGRGGMLLDGPWNFQVWANDAPDFSFGVAPLPAPADHGYLTTTGVGGNNHYAVSASAPEDHKMVAADLLHFLGSQPGQEVWARYNGSADPAWSDAAIAKVRESGELPAAHSAAFSIYEDLVRLGPDPLVSNLEAEAVSKVMRAVKPAIASVVQGYLLGEVSDLRATLRDLSERSDQELDRAIGEAQKNGAEVSREDWVFENWNPAQDYTPEDYAG